MNDLVHAETRDHVRWLVLDAPPTNGYSYDLMRRLDERILEARMDPEVHVLVLTGAGERFFCAGADIDYLRGLDATTKYFFCLHANETLRRLEETPKLVLAALNGHTVGGGLEVALACDLRIAWKRPDGEKPPRVGLPEVKLGVLPGTGGTQRLVRLLGKARALEWMATGENRTLEDAAAAGVVDRLVEAASLAAFRDRVQEFAASFCPPSAASRAVGLIKRACQSGAEAPLSVGLALERELQQRLFEGLDAKEGLAAFLEKRPPRFEGR